MNFLQFSDFHTGKNDPDQITALGMLVDFAFKQIEHFDLTIDLVILAGDLAYSGSRDEFKTFEDEFLAPIKINKRLSEARFIAVPGNHDVDCNATLPITWDSIKGRNQSTFFADTKEGSELRSSRAKIFTEYKSFVERNGIISPDPFNEITSSFYDTELNVNFVLTNTSFFSDYSDDSSKPITPCPLNSLRAKIKSCKPDSPIIVIGHHCSSCFISDHYDPFENLLTDSRAFYIHGHLHNPKVSYNSDGSIRKVGFGAAYTTKLNQSSAEQYRNSFALGKLKDNFALKGFSWIGEKGVWRDTTDLQFSEGLIREESVKEGWISLRVPTKYSSAQSVQSQPLNKIPRKSAQPSSIAAISLENENLWLLLLSLTENLHFLTKKLERKNVELIDEKGGKITFVISDEGERHLLVCIQANTHLLSHKELESYNTTLDSEDYSSVTIISFGKIADDANNLYLRLSRKPIEVKTNADLTRSYEKLISIPQKEFLRDLGQSPVNLTVLIAGESIFLIAVFTDDEDSYFKLIDSNGDRVNPSSPLVIALRTANPSFSNLRYEDESEEHQAAESIQFDESSYFEECQKRFNVMRYKALSNVGLRLSDLSFEDLYIEGKASEVEGRGSDRINDMIEDRLATYPLADSLKNEFREKLRSGRNILDREESSAAQEFYQNYGAILVTGDPGSGKTCFVQNQILSYSSRDSDKNTDSWYSNHIPVLIQLSQAVAESDFQERGILEVGARILQRQGFNLSPAKLKELFDSGLLALFFDGLDEVVSVERRAVAVQQINDLVESGLSKGNRFIVTSRQAAVQVVDLLPSLHELELKGLSTNEIRELSRRILTLKLASEEDELRIGESAGTDEDHALLQKIMEDCESNPGINRIARNPLLLTLLVMIYANSGAPSAKRHLIYAEAVKTLANVRAVAAGHSIVSVQDLRERLGAVALSVYKNESGFLPTYQEVSAIIAEVMSRTRQSSVGKIEAGRFIQKVAESTGLISIEGDDNEAGEDSAVTFMHHSFLEYFAALALAKDLASVDLRSLVSTPRWHEVLTLLAGIVGENDDVTLVLEQIIGDGEHYGEIGGRLLLFALDCALETDVPSDSALRLLSQSLIKCVVDGPARLDPWVRGEIGSRLADMFSTCGVGEFENAFCELLKHTDSYVVAAGIDFVAKSCRSEGLELRAFSLIDELSSSKDEVVLAAICRGAAENQYLRSPLVFQCISRSLKRSKGLRRAGFNAIASIPNLASKNWDNIINGLSDKDYQVRRVASAAAMQAGLNADLAALNSSRRDILIEALKLGTDVAWNSDFDLPTVSKLTVENLLESPNRKDRLVAFGILPWISEDPEFAYKWVSKTLQSSSDHEELTAVINSARVNPLIRAQFVSSDLSRSVALLRISKIDVRIACARLLGCFPNSVGTIEALLSVELRKSDTTEYGAVVGGLAKSNIMKDAIVAKFRSELEHFTHSQVKRTDVNNQCLCYLLTALSDLGEHFSDKVPDKIASLHEDYRNDDSVRRAAILAYAATSVPSAKVVAFISQLFLSNQPKFRLEIAQSLGVFAENCRQSIDYVVACVDALTSLIENAKSYHLKLNESAPLDDTEFCLTELRDGIYDITQIINTFQDLMET